VDNPSKNKLSGTPLKKEAPANRERHMPATFRALRHRNFFVWFIGQSISLVGTWMQTVAQQVLIYRLTGSAVSLGIMAFIGLLPVIPLSLWGGSISDRFPRRTIILITQSVMMIEAFILAALTWSGRIQVWHVFVLAFFLSATNAVDVPTRQAFTVDMIEGKEDLTNAVALNSAMFNMARALGPALAGVVVAVTGEAMAFFVNGLSFVAVIISLLMMHNLPAPIEDAGRDTSTIRHMANGIQYVFDHSLVLALTSMVAVSAFLSMPYITLLPVFAGNVVNVSAQPVVTTLCGGTTPLLHCIAPDALPLGMLYAMMGIGAVIGALIVASLPENSPRGKLLTVGNLCFPVLVIFFAFSRSFIHSLVLLLAIGIFFVWQNALANTLLQLITPDDLRGRVMSFYTLTFSFAAGLGGLEAGFMSDRIGAPLVVGIGGILSFFYAVFVVIKFPSVRKL